MAAPVTINVNLLIWLCFWVSVAGLGFVVYLTVKILRQSPGTTEMQRISGLIHEGAMAFLGREYRYIAIFVVVIGAIILFGIPSWPEAVAFVVGALCSVFAGYIGMQIGTRANARTAEAAKTSLDDGLKVAFPSGMVMGLSVASLGLLGLSGMFLFLSWNAGLKIPNMLERLVEATNLIVGFSMGASLVALFARVGGGIFTKAADVGADLVGKVEAGIPEDDPRNPAVIADNVGDNVGDIAGMGADLYESYVGAVVASLVIAGGNQDPRGMVLALLLAGWGLISSVAGYFFVRIKAGGDPQTGLMKGLFASSVILVAGALFLTGKFYGNISMFWAVLVGLASGLVVGVTAERFTSGKTVENLARSAMTGAGTNIIAGVAIGMMSTVIPLVAIAIAIIIAYTAGGVFGIALAAIGMLSITGMTVAVDAYGPVADNAAGIAEMARLGPEVRKRAERLDAVGNTTAAIGKGFAIGSAALTALALFSAYAQVAKIKVIDVLDAKVIAGLFIGGVIPFLFSARTMQAVGRAAQCIVDEVRRQFREIPGLMEGKANPDSTRCVDITTRAAIKEMIGPGILAIIVPFIVGVILGAEALGGFLAGSLVTGVPLAIFLANAGGAWDNAKKFVEEGNLGGKGSDTHKATVIGDTVGDPFKDTAGPSLNILLKLMSIVSLVFYPFIKLVHRLLFSLL